MSIFQSVIGILDILCKKAFIYADFFKHSLLSHCINLVVLISRCFAPTIYFGFAPTVNSTVLLRARGASPIQTNSAILRRARDASPLPCFCFTHTTNTTILLRARGASPLQLTLLSWYGLVVLRPYKLTLLSCCGHGVLRPYIFEFAPTIYFYFL